MFIERGGTDNYEDLLYIMQGIFQFIYLIMYKKRI